MHNSTDAELIGLGFLRATAQSRCGGCARIMCLYDDTSLTATLLAHPEKHHSAGNLCIHTGAAKSRD